MPLQRPRARRPACSVDSGRDENLMTSLPPSNASDRSLPTRQDRFDRVDGRGAGRRWPVDAPAEAIAERWSVRAGRDGAERGLPSPRPSKPPHRPSTETVADAVEPAERTRCRAGIGRPEADVAEPDHERRRACAECSRLAAEPATSTPRPTSSSSPPGGSPPPTSTYRRCTVARGPREPVAPLQATGPSASPAEPQWPARPEWPAPRASVGLPFLGRPAQPTRRGRVPVGRHQPRTGGNARRRRAGPTSGIQPCVSCGLSLSANARFCRRCGTLQGG